MSIKNVAFFVFVCLFDVYMLFMLVKFSCKKNNESIFELDTSLHTLLLHDEMCERTVEEDLIIQEICTKTMCISPAFHELRDCIKY